MAVDIFTVVLVGKLIEPLWGALEMMTFFFIINTGNVLSMLSDHGQYSRFITGVAVLCAIFYYLLYMITENVDLLFQVHKMSRTVALQNFQVHIHGLSGYLAGVSIAVKQVMPDHVLAR